MSALTLGRDPFARHTIRRVNVPGARCDFCDSQNRYGGAWQYQVDADSPRESGNVPGQFCSAGCASAYHE